MMPTAPDELQSWACRVRSTRALMDERHVAEFYDAVGSSYDGSPYFLACDPIYQAEIARLVAGRRLRRVLDLGCGTGKQTVLLAPHAEEVWAIDLSAESLRQAEARCARAGFRNARFLQQSIVALPAEDGSVDAIVSYGDVISHVHDAYREVFRESARVLAPGGLMAFEVDGKWELDMLLHNPVERTRARAARGVGHLRVWRDISCKTFTGPELAGILREVGLRVVRIRGVNIFHCLLPEAILFGLPQEMGAGWRLASAALQRVDAAVGALPGLGRLASTRLVVAVKG
jgi:ubiquinone/menaquinone biosynthesis C-methylase UbiE